MFTDSIEINLSEELGYNYLYHYNPYSGKHYCIYRDDYDKYWNGFRDQVKIGWTNGDTLEEAQVKMLQRSLGVAEDGIVGPNTIQAFKNKS